MGIFSAECPGSEDADGGGGSPPIFNPAAAATAEEVGIAGVEALVIEIVDPEAPAPEETPALPVLLPPLLLPPL